MLSKTKGTKAERELIHLFWGKGWAAVRVAGSGSSRFPSPDLLAGKGVRKLAIECKAVGGTSRYISIEQIEELKKFSEIFGAEAWVGLRFDREDWLFIMPSELEKKECSFGINIEQARRNGILFEELLSLMEDRS